MVSNRHFRLGTMSSKNFSFNMAKTSHANSFLFIYHRDNLITIFLLVYYVNDIVYTSNNARLLSHFIDSISKKFSLEDIGNLHYFLRVEIIPLANGLFLFQHKYILDIFERTIMDEAKGVSTPMAASVSLILDDGSRPVDATRCRKVVGSLQYLSFARPNIAFAVN